MLNTKGQNAIAVNTIRPEDVVLMVKKKDKYIFLLDDGSTVFHYKLGSSVFEWTRPFPFK